MNRAVAAMAHLSFKWLLAPTPPLAFGCIGPHAQAECEDTRQHNLEGAAGHANQLFQALVRYVGRAVCMPIVERRGTADEGGIVVA